MKLILSHDKFYANSESSTLLVKTGATDQSYRYKATY